MSSTTRDAKDQPLEDENRPGRPEGPSRHWQTSADALYAMAREVSRLRGAVVTERHWCAEYVRGRVCYKVIKWASRPPPATSHQPTTQHNTTQHNTTHTKIWQLHAHQASESASPSSSCSCSSPLSSLLSSPPSPRGRRRLARLL